MGYCTVCDFTPGACGFDPMVCDAIQKYSSGTRTERNLKAIGITTDIAIHDGTGGYMTDYFSREFRMFGTKAEAVKYIEEVCDKNGIR